ncbi:Serine/threonine-protein kinase smu1, partial [Coemansia sp. RSA 2599]
MDIESADVIRLIQQFLKEHSLHRTLEVLQDETGVTLNTVDSVEAFKDDIVKGRWDVVLTNVEHANIPHANLVDLYEQIIIELIELQDIGPARALLRQTEPMEIMRKSQPERYLKIEKLLSQSTLGSSISAYRGNEGNEARRLRIARKLVGQVSTAPANRLLTLLGQAIKWQQQNEGLVVAEGMPFD